MSNRFEQTELWCLNQAMPSLVLYGNTFVCAKSLAPPTDLCKTNPNTNYLELNTNLINLFIILDNFRIPFFFQHNSFTPWKTISSVDSEETLVHNKYYPSDIDFSKRKKT